MNIKKVKQQYIDLHGNTEKFDIMLNERNERLIMMAVEKHGLTREQAKEQIDFFDSLDEENAFY